MAWADVKPPRLVPAGPFRFPQGTRSTRSRWSTAPPAPAHLVEIDGQVRAFSLEARTGGAGERSM